MAIVLSTPEVSEQNAVTMRSVDAQIQDYRQHVSSDGGVGSISTRSEKEEKTRRKDEYY